MANSKTPNKKNPPKQTPQISKEERYQMTEEAAYYIAEQRGFEGGCQLHDWLEAKTKIDHIYGNTESN